LPISSTRAPMSASSNSATFLKRLSYSKVVYQ
jgi:hypothetical protein